MGWKEFNKKAWEVQDKIEAWWKDWPWKKRKEMVFLGLKSILYIFILYMFSVNGLMVYEDGGVNYLDLFILLVWNPIFFAIIVFILPSVFEGKFQIKSKFLTNIIRKFKRRN